LQTHSFPTRRSSDLSTATRSIANLQQMLSDTQAKVNGTFSTYDSRFVALDSNLRAANEKLVQVGDELAGLKQVIAKAQSQGPGPIDPTDPIQLFSAAYGEYLKGHYELAIDQFNQFLQRFPTLETADDAQYWIGDSLYSLGRYDEAVDQLDKVIKNYPQSNKLLAARLKKALALIQLKQEDEAVRELRIVAKGPANAPETIAAKQRLDQMGVPVEEPKATRPVRRKHR
jgi:tol-pal system protein YbgF